MKTRARELSKQKHYQNAFIEDKIFNEHLDNECTQEKITALVKLAKQHNEEKYLEVVITHLSGALLLALHRPDIFNQFDLFRQSVLLIKKYYIGERYATKYYWWTT